MLFRHAQSQYVTLIRIVIIQKWTGISFRSSVFAIIVFSQISWFICHIIAFSARISYSFVLTLFMMMKITCRGGRKLTLIAWKHHAFLFAVKMLLQIDCRGWGVITLITRISYPIMFRFNMFLQSVRWSCGLIALNPKMVIFLMFTSYVTPQTVGCSCFITALVTGKSNSFINRQIMSS